MNKPLKKIFVVFVLCIIAIQFGFAQDITTGLVAHYKFEETSSNSGDPVVDAAGTHNGEIVGVGIQHGIDNTAHGTGNAFSFDGTSYILLPEASEDIIKYGEFTLSAWVKPSVLSVHKTIISLTNPDRDFVFKFYDTTLNIHHFNDGYRRCSATSTSQTNQWIHVLCTWENFHWKIYYNGLPESTCDFSNDTILWISNKLQIGAMNSAERFAGLMDEVRIYNRALTEDDVMMLYTSTGGVSTPTLAVLDIIVNEGTGTATFPISMIQTSGQEVSGDYATSDVTALSGSDYTAASGSFSIPAGQLSTTVELC